VRFLASPRSATPGEALPERERGILNLVVARHETNPEIARRLHPSRKTVRNNVSNIFTKLRVADRARAIIRAGDAGLGSEEA
jgi:DNA-binding NarL/FixJ family response regulator